MLIGAATIDITPDRPISLGSGRPPGPFTTIADRLEANLLCLPGSVGPVLLVSLDLLYPGDRLRRGLLSRLASAFDESRLFLCASHTHSGPMTSDGMPGLGEPDHAYVDWLADRIAAAVPALATAATPVASEAACRLAINRRLRRFMIDHRGIGRRVAMAPNPDGPRDDVVRMIRFDGAAGRPVAIVWSYACHPNAYPVPHAVSADYPGVVRERLRREFGPIPVLFLQGFSGDLRPPFCTTDATVLNRFTRWLRGPRFRRPGLAEWRAWAGEVASAALSAARAPGKQLPTGAVHAHRRAIDGVFSPAVDSPPALAWHILEGDGWKILGINAEPVVAYRDLVQQRFPYDVLLTTGCIGQTRFYLPADRMIEEGGYEVDGFRRPFAFSAKWHAGFQQRVLNALPGPRSRRIDQPVRPVTSQPSRP
jgi:hypothetical protein